MMSAEKLMDKVNARLKAGKVGLVLELCRDRIALRGTLPPKPNSGKSKPYQQRIYLGYPFSQAGILQAEKDARSISAALIEKRFDWQDWSKSQQNSSATTPTKLPIGELIQQFEADYFNRRQRTAQSETTFELEYRAVFRHLPPDRELSLDVILQAITTTAPDTRMRVRYCQTLQALAKFYGLDVNLKPYRGNYSARKVAPRNLPTDEQIVEAYHTIPNPAWQWVYGVLACLGLRPHEAFHLDLSQLPGARVLQGKTGARIVYPIYPEWVELFKIAEVIKPNCHGKNNRDWGDRVSAAFNRYKLPFSPYDLRHAYAIRAMVTGVPDGVASQWMGHSLLVHNRTYQRWTKDNHHQQVYESVFGTTRQKGAVLQE